MLRSRRRPGPLPPAAGPRSRGRAGAEARRQRGGQPGPCTAPRSPGTRRRPASVAGRAAAGALGGGGDEGCRAAARCPPARPSAGAAAAAVPRARPRARRGLARLAPSRSRPQRDPGRAERQARPAGTGSPGRAEPALRDVFPGGGNGSPAGTRSIVPPRTESARGTHGPRRGQAAAGPRRAWGHPCVIPAFPAAASSPAGAPGAVTEPAPPALPASPLRWGPDQARFGGTRAAISQLGKPRERGDRCSGPAEPLEERDRAGASGEGLREPGEGAAPVPAGGCQPRDAAPGLSQAGWAGVTGLLTVILFISLAASPELCLQRGLVVPAAPALCLDRGLL